MVILKFLGLFAVVNFCLSSARAADDATNREVIQTFVVFHLGAKEFDKAEEKLLQHLQSDTKDAERWNLLGLVYTEMKKFKEADSAFAKAVEVSDGDQKGLYLYNHANVVNKSGNTSKAKGLLNAAAQYESIRASALHALDVIKPNVTLPTPKIIGEGHWTYGFNVSGGYDTNVQLLAINTMDSITRSDTTSPTATVGAKAQYLREYYSGQFDFNSNISYSHYFTDTTKKYNSISANAAAKILPDMDDIFGFKWGGGMRFNITYLNTSGFQFYNWTDTLAFEGVKIHNENLKTMLEFPIRYQAYAASSDATNDRTGVAGGFKLTQQRKMSGNQLSYGIEIEKVWTNGNNYKSIQYTIPLTFARLLGFWNLAAVANLRGGQVYYLDSTGNRRDTNVVPTLALSKMFSSQTAANLSYTYTRNLSTVDTAAYQKHLIMLAVNHDF